MTNSRLALAESLLEIKAVNLSATEPYTWASGLKSPIYCDNRMTLGYPALRESIAEQFAAIIEEEYPEASIIAGTATAGIPHAAFLASRLGKPMCYIRSSAKAHGRQNLIEGPLPSDSSVIVVEDLVSTGMSSLKAVDAIKATGATVLGVLAIFTYGLDKATSAFADAGVKLHTLTDYRSLLKTAEQSGMINDRERHLLEEWQKNPREWGSRYL